MKIFPAIDIKDKKCVRLVKGDFDNKTVYEMSPVDQAGKYKDHGFKNLHIVDLDGALTGETVNLDIIQEIVHKFDILIEVGGGIRTIDGIEKYINVGVEKVILGSSAIKDKNFLKEACQKFPNKIALGLDAKDGYLSVSGWKENSNQITLDYLSEIINNPDFKKREIKLPIALGKNISGKPIVGDLASMPHLLIAGTTGSGKSVCINTIILSLLYRHTPDRCKFILIDPKMLELSTYEGIPHLLCPVITEAKKAASVLGWAQPSTDAAFLASVITGHNKCGIPS